MTAASIAVRIRRGAPGEASRIETFDVPWREGMSALDALVWVRTNVDSTLGVRYACINANACKECMIRIDGRAGYACTARLGPGGALLEPLDNKALIRDLVTDVVPPKERLAAHLPGGG